MNLKKCCKSKIRLVDRIIIHTSNDDDNDLIPFEIIDIGN